MKTDPKNLWLAEIGTQKFNFPKKTDPKIYFQAQKVPSKNGTSRTPTYGCYPPPENLDDIFGSLSRNNS